MQTLRFCQDPACKVDNKKMQTVEDYDIHLKHESVSLKELKILITPGLGKYFGESHIDFQMNEIQKDFQGYLNKVSKELKLKYEDLEKINQLQNAIQEGNLNNIESRLSDIPLLQQSPESICTKQKQLEVQISGIKQNLLKVYGSTGNQMMQNSHFSQLKAFFGCLKGKISRAIKDSTKLDYILYILVTLALAQFVISRAQLSPN